MEEAMWWQRTPRGWRLSLGRRPDPGNCCATSISFAAAKLDDSRARQHADSTLSPYTRS